MHGFFYNRIKKEIILYTASKPFLKNYDFAIAYLTDF
jgi:hypothetical protein